MPTLFAPTEKQIAENGNDFYLASARLEHEASFRKSLAADPENAPWRIEPTADEVALEMRNRGWDAEFAEAQLKREMVADAKRLVASAPKAGNEIAEAFAAADLAKQRADELLAEQSAQLDFLKSSVLELVGVRQQLKILRTLVLDSHGASSVANAAMQYFLAKHSDGGLTQQNQTGWDANIQDLCYRSILTPHVGGFAAKLESQAREFVSTIKRTAKESGVDLPSFLRTIADALPADKTLFADLAQ